MALSPSSSDPARREVVNILSDEEAPAIDRRSIELERFRTWRRTGNMAVRDAIIADAQGIVVGLAKRYRNRGVEFDDLQQVAQIGLLQAVERFDPDRGIPFLSFATPTVLGELRRHFRKVWTVRPPRGLQEASLRLTPVVLELQQELQRSPTIAELATRMGMSKERVLEAMEASSAFRASSLDVNRERVDDQHGVRPRPQLRADEAEAAFETADAKITVERLLPLLSPRTRRIVELRFFENLSQNEIAEVVGVSQMHVSRLLRQAFITMSSALTEPSESDQ